MKYQIINVLKSYNYLSAILEIKGSGDNDNLIKLTL